jgi:hypothetical protein
MGWLPNPKKKAQALQIEKERESRKCASRARSFLPIETRNFLRLEMYNFDHSS